MSNCPSDLDPLPARISWISEHSGSASGKGEPRPLTMSNPSLITSPRGHRRGTAKLHNGCSGLVGLVVKQIGYFPGRGSNRANQGEDRSSTCVMKSYYVELYIFTLYAHIFDMSFPVKHD